MRYVVLLALLLLIPAPAVRGAPTPAPDPANTKEEIAAQRAADWILRAQNQDGSWGIDPGTPGDITCTALASLALMTDGTSEREGSSRSTVRALRKSLTYLLAKVKRMRQDIAVQQSTLIAGKLGKNIHNFFATVYFTQIYGMRPGWIDPSNLEDIRDYLGSLVKRIAETQEPDGSWHKNTFGSLKATCMAWMALRAANSAGINVQKAAVEKTLAFIRKQYNATTHMYTPGGGSVGYQAVYATATCIRVLYAIGEGDEPHCKEAARTLIKYVTQTFKQTFLSVEGEDYMSAALITQALMFEDGELFREWHPWITKRLMEKQARDGSWTGTACIHGRTFATCNALLTFRAPLRLLPILEQ